MTNIPHEAGLTAFTPPSLADLPAPPVFMIRTATRREKTAFRGLLFAEGLETYSSADLRGEVIKGLRALWDEATFAAHEPRLRSFWDAQDDHAAHRQNEPFAHPDIDAVADLTDEITKAWRPLREMSHAILTYREESPRQLLRVLLAGWRGIDVQVEKAAGIVTSDAIDALADALEALERAHEANHDGIVPGGAFVALCLHAYEALYLPRDTEKNFASPSNSISSPTISKTAGRGSRNGRSPAKPMRKTRAH